MKKLPLIYMRYPGLSFDNDLDSNMRRNKEVITLGSISVAEMMTDILQALSELWITVGFYRSTRIITHVMCVTTTCHIWVVCSIHLNICNRGYTSFNIIYDANNMENVHTISGKSYVKYTLSEEIDRSMVYSHLSQQSSCINTAQSSPRWRCTAKWSVSSQCLFIRLKSLVHDAF